MERIVWPAELGYHATTWSENRLRLVAMDDSEEELYSNDSDKKRRGPTRHRGARHVRPAQRNVHARGNGQVRRGVSQPGGRYKVFAIAILHRTKLRAGRAIPVQNA
eukprot:jgi/Mesvir1/20397/Mv12301-RA.1